MFDLNFLLEYNFSRNVCKDIEKWELIMVIKE